MLSPYFLKMASISWGKSSPLSTIMPTSFAGSLEGRFETIVNWKQNETNAASPYVRSVLTGGTPRFEGGIVKPYQMRAPMLA